MCGFVSLLSDDNMVPMQPPPQRSRRALLGFLALACVVASCAEIGEPDLGAELGPDPVTSSTVAEPGSDPIGDETAGTAPEALVIRDFAPQRPQGYLPSVVVGTTDGLTVWDGDVEPTPLLNPFDTVQTDKIVDDFAGGLLVQRAGAEVLWFGAQGGEPVVLQAGAGDLQDAGFLDATGAIYALVAVGGTRVDAVGLGGGEPIPLIQLEDGQTLLDLSASNGLHAVAVSDQNCGDLIFFNSVGKRVDLGGPGVPVCVVARRATYGAVALSPDRSTVVYTEQTYRSDGVVALTRVIAQNLATKTELFNVAIGSAGEMISNLSFDGTRLVFVRSGPEGDTVEILDPVTADSPLVLQTGEQMSATFARQPLVAGRATLQE